MKSIAIEQNLLATHVSDNPAFESACRAGDCDAIMKIVCSEMETKKLFTKGALKLKNDIFRMTCGKARVPAYVGSNILAFVWNARLSGTGFGVN